MNLSFERTNGAPGDPVFVHMSFAAADIKQTELPRYYTASGYGSKIPTSYMVRIGKRWHRVYCACYSNSGTCYVLHAGKCTIVELEPQL